MNSNVQMRHHESALTIIARDQQARMSSRAKVFISPSLHIQTPESLPAYEVKFVLTETQAQSVEEALRVSFAPDPHASCNVKDGYSTTTIYCDTPEFDVYHRRGNVARRKFRVRRYGDGECVYLERKAKNGWRVRKRRSCIALNELDRLHNPATDNNWNGHWFHRRIAMQRLSPILAVSYDRTAFVGGSEDSPMRLTFDRSIRGLPVTGWDLDHFGAGHAILPDRVICEFKFRGAMPTPFKAVIAAQQLSPGSASKYRLCLEASGSVSTAGEFHA